MSNQSNSTKMLHRLMRDERYQREMKDRPDHDLQDQRQTKHAANGVFSETFLDIDPVLIARSIRI